jgi:AcrR family transcriptional regulator
MAEVMAEKGYVGTSVADVLKRAGVSRQSFYELFDSKLDCFMAAFECAGELMLERLSGAVERAAPTTSDPLALFERAITAYLQALSEELPYARLFLVEVFAAGPEAIRRRTRLQGVISDHLADLLGAATETGRFACRACVAAASALVTAPVADGDREALHALSEPLLNHVRALWDAGIFTGTAPQHH